MINVYINQINNNSNTNFNALKKISCSGAGTFLKCTFNEERIVDELKKIAKTDTFFKKYDVKAYVAGYNGNMSLKLTYKPISNSWFEKFKRLFESKKVIELAEKRNCTTDATYYLAKRLRKINSFAEYI